MFILKGADSDKRLVNYFLVFFEAVIVIWPVTQRFSPLTVEKYCVATGQITVARETRQFNANHVTES